MMCMRVGDQGGKRRGRMQGRTGEREMTCMRVRDRGREESEGRIKGLGRERER